MRRVITTFFGFLARLVDNRLIFRPWWWPSIRAGTWPSFWWLWQWSAFTPGRTGLPWREWAWPHRLPGDVGRSGGCRAVRPTRTWAWRSVFLTWFLSFILCLRFGLVFRVLFDKIEQHVDQLVLVFLHYDKRRRLKSQPVFHLICITDKQFYWNNQKFSVFTIYFVLYYSLQLEITDRRAEWYRNSKVPW